MNTQTWTQDRSDRGFAARPTLGGACVLLVAAWTFSCVATGQCNATLQSGGPIAALRGNVLTSVLWDPDGAGPLPQWLVVGGAHLTGGDQASPVGLLAYDGSQWLGLGFDVDQSVIALTVFNGDLIAAGNFSLPVGGGVAASIARRSGSTWQALGSGMNGSVEALAVFGGNLIAGGRFLTAGGVQTPRIAKWNGTAWSALAQSPFTSTAGPVLSLCSFGSLYVGGQFQTAVGNNLLRWNGTTWSAAGSPSGGAGTTTILAMTSFSGSTQGSSFLIAGGTFSTIGGVTTENIAKAGSGVSTWSAMGPGLPQMFVRALHTRVPFLGSPEVLATCSTISSPVRVMLWNGTTWNALGTLGPAAVASATAPAFYGGYVVGLDNPGAGLRAPSMFRYTSDWEPLLGNGIPTPVLCLAADGADAIVGGAFATIDGVAVHGIARRSGTTWSALGTGVAGGTATVHAVVRAANGDLFAGGSFTSAGGGAASNVARWNGSAWAPLGTGTNGTVLSLLIAANGDLIAGGDFTIAGGVACNRIARWNGTAWSQLASGMDGPVHCLASMAGGQIVAGGAFVLAGGITCNRIALWNGITWASMAGGMDGEVNALALRPNGELAAGGAFTNAGGSPRSRLARWNGLTWLPAGTGLPDTVNALLTLPDGDLLVGGRFAVGNLNRLARWDGFLNSVDAVGFGLSGADVLAFATAANGDVLLGGDIDRIITGPVAGNLAILTTNCPASATPVATACVGPSGPVILVADTLPWMGSTFRSTATGFAAQALAVSVLGFTPNNLPLSAVLPVGLPNCDLLASSDAVLLTIPQAGTSHYRLTLPETPVFVGVPLSHQFVQLALSPTGAITSLSSSNALTLVLGMF
ncbi:MAG: hypothetical protein U1E73_03580 [Planctomycetota bacterium]